MDEAPEATKGVLDALEGMPDAKLQEVVKRAQSIMKGREQEKRREVMRQIQNLAKEHGLKVDVGEKRKRGRPSNPKE